MSESPDLVIRGGTVADGRGGDLFEADVAIRDGRISEVGKISGKGRDEIDARGKLVAPGFVDIHTHYDGQVTWSHDITPSSQNGVTTAVMGNCGVGFAPCRPDDHLRLIQLMEGVEDIPEPVLSAGIPWSWESFPDYMDWLAKRGFDIDIGAQLPHAALRVYVMGGRGARRAEINAAAAKGLSITAQIAARPVGLMLGLELSRNPFQTHPSYKAIAHLPLKERLTRLRQPEVRAAILGESASTTDDPLFFKPNYDKMYLLGDPPDYEQPPENALGAQARRSGKRPEELAYDAMLSDEGRGMLYVPFLNYADGNLDATREMLCDPRSVPGLSDGGAHCGIICDASFPTYLLTHWTRDRKRGEKLSIPFVVAAQSRKTALSVGLYDRGVIAPGYKADVNVIDYDNLHLHPPKVHYDLPVGGRRLLQQVDGYEATIVSGHITRRAGSATGARPGRLVRGAQGEARQFGTAAG